MLSVSVGPLALPVAPLLLLAALVAALLVARRTAGRGAPGLTEQASAAGRTDASDTGQAEAQASEQAAAQAVAQAAAQAESAVWWAAVAGLLAARCTYLALNAQAYLATPWALLDLRDGGWHPVAGLAGALAAALWQARRQAGLRSPLRAAALAAGLVWGAGHTLVWVTGGTAATAGAPAVALLPFATAAGAGAGPASGLDLAPAATEAPSQAQASAAPGHSVLLPALIAGRPAVVNLWASWCGPCRVEMPVLAAAQQAWPDVRFVFVNQGESAAAVQAYLGREGLALQDVWLDPGSRLGPAVGSAGLPTTLFFDAQGRQVDAHMGILNTAALQVQLRRLQDR